MDAELAGRSVDSLWSDARLCNRSTWWNKWSKDPVIGDVLATVRKLAQTWHDGRSVRALAQAAERLALAAPVAVGRAIQMMNSLDEQVVLRASFGILDRAGMETATKSKVDTTTVELSLDEWRAQQKERQAQATQAMDDFANVE